MMENFEEIKRRALEISNRFPFSEFPSQATDANLQGQADDTYCENHLDESFMKLLEEGAHLDIKKVPL